MPAPSSPFSFNEYQIVDPKTNQPWQKQEGVEPGYNLPHVWTFSSVIGAAWRTYYHGQHDDALRNDPEFAVAMRRDPLLMAMLQERKMATVNRKFHIEVNNPSDPAQKAMADGLKLIVDQIPRKRQLFSYLLEAIWFGRYGSQLKYQDRILSMPSWQSPGQRMKVKIPVPVAHQPVHGDKIGYMYDGTPYVQVYNPKSSTIPGAAIIPTTQTRSIALVGSWRTNFILHMHESLDADYWTGERAGSIYGIGVRHVLYWLAWLKRELLANILTYAERTGMGLKLWKYQAGNDTSRKAVEEAAYAESDRTNILVPVTTTNNGRPIEGVEFVETGGSMAALLLEILRHFDDEIERYVVGQSLSSGTEGNGLGGSGVAGFHQQTKANLTEYDAENLGETLTFDLILKLARLIYPAELVDDASPCFRFDVAPPSPSEVLSTARAYFDMGGSLEDDSVRAVTGLPKPQDGEPVLSSVALQKAQLAVQQDAQMAQMQAQQAMMPQQPPGGAEAAGGAGGEPEANEDGDGDEGGQPSPEDFDQIVQELTGGQQQNSRNSHAKHYDRLSDIRAAAADVDPNPSDAAKAAGNYRMGHVHWKGLPITLEIAKGQKRRGTNRDGVSWEHELQDNYGYIKRTFSAADGDSVDVYLCEDDPDSDIVFCVNQMWDGKFNEHKFILGQSNIADARKAYLRNYKPGWKGMGDVVAMTISQFRRWLEDADTGEKVEPDKYDHNRYALPGNPLTSGVPQHNNAVMKPTRLFRASDHEDVRPGFSFSGNHGDASHYLDNPGFGGSKMFSTHASLHGLLDLTGSHPWDDLSEAIGDEVRPERHQFHFPSTITASDKILDALRKKGHRWAKFIDDYPEGSTTYVPLSDDAAEEAENNIKEHELAS